LALYMMTYYYRSSKLSFPQTSLSPSGAKIFHLTRLKKMYCAATLQQLGPESHDNMTTTGYHYSKYSKCKSL
jgi:hypothetical protein